MTGREKVARTRVRRRVHAIRRERSADDRPAWCILVTEMVSLLGLIAAGMIWFLVLANLIAKITGVTY